VHLQYPRYLRSLVSCLAVLYVHPPLLVSTSLLVYVHPSNRSCLPPCFYCCGHSPLVPYTLYYSIAATSIGTLNCILLHVSSVMIPRVLPSSVAMYTYHVYAYPRVVFPLAPSSTSTCTAHSYLHSSSTYSTSILIKQ
jgi:hypothetical protein